MIAQSESIQLPEQIDGPAIADITIKPLSKMVLQSEKLLAQPISTHYYLPQVLWDYLESIDQLKITHISSLLADYFHLTAQPKVLVFFNSKRFHLLISHQEGLRFYNSYHYETPQDVLYFILSVLETNHLDPQVTPVKLAGRIAAESPIFQLLEGYLADLDFVDILPWKSKVEAPAHLVLDLYLSLA